MDTIKATTLDWATRKAICEAQDMARDYYVEARWRRDATGERLKAKDCMAIAALYSAHARRLMGLE